MIILLVLILTIFAPVAHAQPTDDVLAQSPTLARLTSADKLDLLHNPKFTDREAALRFASDCAKVAADLDKLQALPPYYSDLRDRAALAAEFLPGETHILATSKIGSVVELREEVKIPAPDGFVYVREYASESSMPPVVRRVLASLKQQEGTRIQGVTIRGRYIALLKSQYKEEVADTLEHEMVHSYLALASGVDLPYWFHEGAAVYFSLGDKGKLYNRVDDPVPTRRVRVPDDYKSALHSFQYIESKVGRDKLFEFIRRGVDTGTPDPRMALGMATPGKTEPARPPSVRRLPVPAIVVGSFLVLLAAAWIARRRQETW